MQEQATNIEDAVRIMRSSNDERDSRRMALDLAVKWHTHFGGLSSDDALLTTAEGMRKFLVDEE